MTKQQPSEADTAIAIAEAFSDTPPKWAIEARRRELREAGEPEMSVAEATNIQIGVAFGRVKDQALIAEADAVMASQRGGASASAGNPQARLTAVMAEVAVQAQRTMGMSAERAQLEAQSQALRCRETTSTISEALTKLEAHRDAMEKAPGVGRKTFVDGKRVTG